MDMTGEQRIPASREAVWQALNDPDVLAQCIPGCETLEKVSDTEFKATVTAKVGPVKAKFAGNVTLSDLDPPNGYRLSGEGQGAGAGFAKGGAEVRLSEDGAETVLTYEVNAQVGGKLAQVGSRLIDGTARKLAGEFFTKFSAVLTEPTGVAAEEPAVEAAPGAEAKAGGMNPIVWVVGLLVVVGLLLLVFGR